MSDQSTTHYIEAAVESGSKLIPSDVSGRNFWKDDRAVRELLSLYVPPAELAHFEPHLDSLGAIAGGRLNELAILADRNPPVLHSRDKFGRNHDWVEYHPAYREMEKIAWSDFGMGAMSHRAGVFDWPGPVSPLIKYTFTYLFVQAEFGIMCPISGSDTAAHALAEHADDALKARLANMLSQDMGELIKMTQFMTEKAGGSDLGTNTLKAVQEEGVWRLYGEKWFCSHVDADYALVLARPDGAVAGTRGLAAFAVPRHLDDGSRNRLRIVRLKDKLGTKSMATGEVMFEGALAYLVGDVNNGIKVAVAPVNLSRLSHGVRAAAMMRRCLNEAIQVANSRVAFKSKLIDLPLMRRSLMKLMVPTEQALSTYLFVAATMQQAHADGLQSSASALLRIVTALFKFRACRDNIRVATGAMEVRGGLGYIEEWINERLVRDAHIGVLWEGTSNINGIDIITRAVRKENGDGALGSALREKLAHAGIPAGLRTALSAAVDKSLTFARWIADRSDLEQHARTASSLLYHATSATLLAWEGAELGQQGGDARRLLLAWMVLRHRLAQHDPCDLGAEAQEQRAISLLLPGTPVSLQDACAALAG